MRQSNPPFYQKNFQLLKTVGGTTQPTQQVPWQYGMNQKIQASKIVASTGQFSNLTGTLAGTTTFSGAVFQNGTLANNLVTGGTVTLGFISNATIQGTIQNNGTLYNGNYATAQYTGGTTTNQLMSGGTIDGAVFGTPSGTVNPLAYKINGTAGSSGSVVYVKTVSPGTTFGTINFNNGIIISFN